MAVLPDHDRLIRSYFFPLVRSWPLVLRFVVKDRHDTRLLSFLEYYSHLPHHCSGRYRHLLQRQRKNEQSMLTEGRDCAFDKGPASAASNHGQQFEDAIGGRLGA